MFLEVNNLKPDIKKALFIAPNAVIIGDVRIDEGSSIWFGSILRGDINFIRIGKRSNIQDGCVIHVNDDLPVEIGNDVVVGHMAVLHGCVIEDGCLIGMRAVVLDGAKVGRESVIAAGALIPEGKVIPPRSLVMGVPGKIIRQVTDEESKKIKALAKGYMNLARMYL